MDHFYSSPQRWSETTTPVSTSICTERRADVTSIRLTWVEGCTFNSFQAFRSVFVRLNVFKKSFVQHKIGGACDVVVKAGRVDYPATSTAILSSGWRGRPAAVMEVSCPLRQRKHFELVDP